MLELSASRGNQPKLYHYDRNTLQRFSVEPSNVKHQRRPNILKGWKRFFKPFRVYSLSPFLGVQLRWIAQTIIGIRKKGNKQQCQFCKECNGRSLDDILRNNGYIVIPAKCSFSGNNDQTNTASHVHSIIYWHPKLHSLNARFSPPFYTLKIENLLY